MRREVVVGGTRLQNIDESEAVLLMLNRGFEELRELENISAESARNERRLERKDEVHRIERVFRHAVRGRVHRLALPRERARLTGRESVVGIVVEDERDRIIAAQSMDEVPDAFT